MRFISCLLGEEDPVVSAKELSFGKPFLQSGIGSGRILL
jgi:hypothetical protein